MHPSATPQLLAMADLYVARLILQNSYVSLVIPNINTLVMVKERQETAFLVMANIFLVLVLVVMNGMAALAC